MPKLGIKEHKIVKISKKKGDFDKFLGFTLKRAPKLVFHTFYENFLEPN